MPYYDLIDEPVPGDFLDDALTRLGLNMRERCDMITYWLPHLEAFPFNEIFFVDVQRYGETAKLDVSPRPDVVIRVFMVFRLTILCLTVKEILLYDSPVTD